MLTAKSLLRVHNTQVNTVINCFKFNALTAKGAIALALGMALVSCGGPNSQTTENTSPEGASGGSVSLTGAGASFPAPIYKRWFVEYNKNDANTTINYQSVQQFSF
jgi:ABC-type phosphate transport system substrate-binding protein